MRKAMLVTAFIALLPATALAGPDRSVQAHASTPLPTQIATLGGDFPTTLSDEDLVAANADEETAPVSNSQSSPERSPSQISTIAKPDRQPDVGNELPNGQPKYVRIYWFIGGR